MKRRKNSHKTRDKPKKEDRIKVFKLPKIKRKLSEKLAKAYWPYRFVKWLIIDIICVYFIITNFKFIGWTVGTIISIALMAMLAGFSVYNYINCIRALNAHLKIESFKDTLDEDKYALIRYGQPGNGKTFTTSYEAGLSAEVAFDELTFDYWLGIGCEGNLKTEGDKQDWQDIKESFEYNNAGDVIPCLSSNIKIKYSGIESSNFYREHLEQKLKLPYRQVSLADEIGSMVSVDEVNSKRPEEIARFCRWCRQFGDYKIFGTEQDKTRVNKDIRRVVCENRLILSNDRILIPKFWAWLFKKLKKHFVGKYISKSSSKRFGKFMRGFKLFINSVGFRVVIYKNYASTETGGVVVDNKIKKQIFPAIHDYKYDTREFRKDYICRKQPLIKLKGKLNNEMDKAKIKEAVLKLKESLSQKE